MNKFLIRIISSPFSQKLPLPPISDIACRIKQVTLMKSTQTLRPYFIIERKIIDFPLHEMIIQVNSRLFDDQKLQPLQFYDCQLNNYHETTPMQQVCLSPFFVRYNKNIYFILNNIPLFKTNNINILDTFTIPQIIQLSCKNLLKQLSIKQQKYINGITLHNLLIKNMIDNSLYYQNYKILYQSILKLVIRNINTIQKEIKILKQKTVNKKKTTIQIFFVFLLGQYIVFNYYIFLRLSWDIMEPIIHLFINFDLFIAYFIFKKTTWQNNNLTIPNRKIQLKNQGIDIDKYQQLIKIKQYLQFRLALFSNNPLDVMEAMEKPLKMLDTEEDQK